MPFECRSAFGTLWFKDKDGQIIVFKDLKTDPLGFN